MSAIPHNLQTREDHGFAISWTGVGPFVALGALLVIGFLINPDFLSATNLGNVVARSAFIAIIAVGATFVISSGGLDLSVGSMLAVSAVLFALTYHLDERWLGFGGLRLALPDA